MRQNYQQHNLFPIQCYEFRCSQILLDNTLNLIKELGYDTNLNEHLNAINKNNEFLKIKIDGYIYEIPNYLINEKIPEKNSKQIIRKSLYFTRQVMLNKFFIPNNLLFPKSRVIFENYFN